MNVTTLHEVMRQGTGLESEYEEGVRCRAWELID